MMIKKRKHELLPTQIKLTAETTEEAFFLQGFYDAFSTGKTCWNDATKVGRRQERNCMNLKVEKLE